jgi:uncharacterized membrane protein YkoI
MNKIALILVGLALGQTVPATAHAQFVSRLVEQAARVAQGGAETQARPNPEAYRRAQLAYAPQRRQGQGGDRERDPRVNDRMIERPAMELPPMRLVPLNQVIGQIRRSTPGRLLDASGPEGGMRPVYRVRWQADSGQRIDFVIDAQSGAIIGRNGG